MIIGCCGVICNKVGIDYLAYSPLTGETILLSPFANDVLSAVLTKSTIYKDLLDKLMQDNDDAMDDINAGLQRALRELSKKGFVYY